MSVRVRIAPSPTGKPHIGTGYVALFNLALARQQGGQFVLRVEDTDRTRYDPESERLIFDTVRWLGIEWDEGPDVGGPHGPYRQSERLDIYREHAEELVRRGHAYRCWCTPERLERVRKETMERREAYQYDQFCLGKSETERRREPDCGDVAVIRMRMPDEGTTTFTDLIRGDISFENRLIDDQVLLKSDGFPTYHLAVVVDDRLMRISHIVRGEEWISSTPKHVVLNQMFGWEVPQLAHLSLLRNVDKSKISKRKNPWAHLGWFRDEGFLPEALSNFLALMGFSMPDGREQFSFDELAAAFSFDRMSATGPAFDLEKLTWLNGAYVRAMPMEKLVEQVRPLMPASEDAYLRRVVALEQERVHKLSDLPTLAGFFFVDSLEYDVATLVPKGATVAQVIAWLEAAGDELEAVGALATPSELEERFRALAARLDVKAGPLFGAVRVAITGTTKAPPLFDTAVTLGYDRVMSRIEAALTALRSSGAAG